MLSSSLYREVVTFGGDTAQNVNGFSFRSSFLPTIATKIIFQRRGGGHTTEAIAIAFGGGQVKDDVNLFHNLFTAY